MGADDSRDKVRAPPDESLKLIATALSASPWVAHSTNMTYYSLQFEPAIDRMSPRSFFLASIFAFTSTFASSALALGTVAGQFTDAQSGAPVPGVLVELGTAGLGSFSPTGHQALSDAGGHYSMAIPSGFVYALRVTPAAPLLPGYWPNVLCAIGTNCSPPGYGNVSVQDGGSFIGDMTLTSAGSLAGRLTLDSGGAPVGDVTVRLRRIEPSGFAVVQVQSDAVGHYQADGLPPGAYRVYVDGNPSFRPEIYDNVPCSGTCWSGAPGETLVPVLADQIEAGIDIALTRASEIAGNIRNAGSNMLHASVGLRLDRLVDGNWILESTQTVPAGNGNYAFTAIPPGIYTLSTSRGPLVYNNMVYDGVDCAADDCTDAERAAGTQISLSVGQTTTLNPIELQPAASVTACVHDAQTSMPLAGVHVLAYSPTPMPFIGYIAYNSAISAADGCARIDYLPGTPAGLRLRTVNGSGYQDRSYGGPFCINNQCDLGAGTVVPLAHDQNLEGISIALTQGASMAGTVLARANGPGVPNAALELVGADGFSLRYQDLQRLRSAANGSFRTFALPDGSYTLKAQITNENHLTRTYTYGGGPLTISQGNSVEGIVFVLEGETVHASGFESP